jgi:peptidoglycan/xylan/chitin deacetylase (PgdA/CDA1 family)
VGYGTTGTGGALARATAPVLTTPIVDGVKSSPERQAAITAAIAGVSPSPKTFYSVPIDVGFAAWTGSATGAGSVVKQDATDHYGAGVDCAVLNGDGAGATVSISSPTRSTAIDFTNSFPVVAIQVASYAALKNGGGFSLYASSDSTLGTYSHYFQWTWPDPNAANSTTRWVSPDGQWVLVPLYFTSMATAHYPGGESPPSRASIYQFRFRIYDTWTSGDPVAAPHVKLGYLGIGRDVVGQYPNGVITLTFDDGYDLALALPELEARGYKGTLHLIDESLGAAGRLTIAGVNSLRALGWDTALHSHTIAAHNTNYAALGATAALADIQAQIAAFDALGWDRRWFAYPSGAWTGEVLAAVMGTGVRSARTVWLDQAGLRAENWPPPMPGQLAAFSPYSHTVAQINAWIDLVKTQKNWGILALHSVTTSATNLNNLHKDDFAAVIEHIAQAGIPVRTMSQMLP